MNAKPLMMYVYCTVRCDRLRRRRLTAHLRHLSFRDQSSFSRSWKKSRSLFVGCSPFFTLSGLPFKHQKAEANCLAEKVAARRDECQQQKSSKAQLKDVRRIL